MADDPTPGNEATSGGRSGGARTDPAGETANTASGASVPWSARIGLVIGIIAGVALAALPSGLTRIEGFGRRPAYAAAVAATMAIWWLTEALPIAVTACVPLLAFPLLGVFGTGVVGDARRAAEPF